MPESSSHTNRLAQELSPYLQQHAHNPVDWYPWGNEAIAKARCENKPILLSIGYAACHWCHVMAHESFEDNETAQLMNQLFINIKVDKEERPDLDKIYQTAHYLLTQRSGGWPLTAFLTPDDLAPFFSGTYFPLHARYQLPTFKEILLGISAAYKNNYAEIKQQNTNLLNFFKQLPSSVSDVGLNNQPFKIAEAMFQQQYDKKYGGFGTAPKFPQPTKLEYLLDIHSFMAKDTLSHMARGGIYDQLGGGFFRYSVDEAWHIPHFEKMLYDNGQLLCLYSEKAEFAEIARQTADWLINTMQNSKGGFYSSINADSEGKEGKYYVWKKTEVNKILTEQEFSLVQLYFGLNSPSNFEDEWHFYVAHSLSEVAKELNISSSEANQLLNTAKQKLLAARNLRVAPSIDKKILTAWNALTIKAMLIAGYKLNEARYSESAMHALLLIQQKLWVNKRLLASYKDNKAYLSAYLDDYAFLIDALLTSLQINWKTDYLHFAIDLADTLVNYFFDNESGGFFFTANDHETLLYRPKTFQDEAIPAGNGVAARVLLVLGYLLGDSKYLTAAEKTLQAAAPALNAHPTEHGSLLLALKEYLTPSKIIVLRGKIEDMKVWQEKINFSKNYVFAIPDDVANLPASLAGKSARDRTCAYICQGTQCNEIIEDMDKLIKILP